MEWQENLNAAWRHDDKAHIISLLNEQLAPYTSEAVQQVCRILNCGAWAEIEDVHVIPEELEPKKSAPSPSERLASLNMKTAEHADDDRLFSVPPEYIRLMYAEYATSSRPSKITVGNSNAEDAKTILKVLDDALFGTVVAAFNNHALWEYLENGSLGQSAEVCMKMYGEYCGGSAQWQLMVEDVASTLKFRFPLSAFTLDLEGGPMSPNINPECKCCMQGYLMKGICVMHDRLQVTQVCDTRTRQQPPHKYSSLEAPDLEFPECRQRQLSAILTSHKLPYAVKLQAEEKKKHKAIKAEESAEYKQHTAALEQASAVDNVTEKSWNSLMMAEVKVERKKLEKLAKEVAGHDEVHRAAAEKLEMKIGTLEKETTEKIAKWRKEHDAAMGKLTAISDNLNA